jgi:hypothetical protein
VNKQTIKAFRKEMIQDIFLHPPLNHWWSELCNKNKKRNKIIHGISLAPPSQLMRREPSTHQQPHDDTMIQWYNRYYIYRSCLFLLKWEIQWKRALKNMNTKLTAKNQTKNIFCIMASSFDIPPFILAIHIPHPIIV